MSKLTLKSPAKVNLYLNLLGERSDGYHEVETIIQAIDLCDELTLTTTEDGITLSCNDPGLLADESNLVYQAGRLLLEASGDDLGAEIFIKKQIPIAAGLGGGSSNAAAALVGLNEIWKLGFGLERLLELGKRLGVDVPFFVAGYPTALCTGRGEEVTPVESASLWYCLVCPKVLVSTRDVYSRVMYGPPPLTRRKSDVRMLIQALEEGDRRRIKSLLYNGLSEVVKRAMPVVGEVIELMRSLGARGVSMSGSGPTVFALCANRKEAMELGRKISFRRYVRTFVARTYIEGGKLWRSQKLGCS